MKKPNHAGSGQIRIIGGQWRGRKLPVPESPGLRPTTDRVRETLFNWLAPSIVDASCLDCFAGSGALGLEALSRYAANATLLEMERGVAQQLQKSGDSQSQQRQSREYQYLSVSCSGGHAASHRVCRSPVSQRAA